MGVCCSSWVTTSRGSSKRSFLTPMGCTEYKSVALANLMVSRTPSCIWRNLAYFGGVLQTDLDYQFGNTIRGEPSQQNAHTIFVSECLGAV